MSGRPDNLQAFVESLPLGITVVPTTVNAMYHSLSNTSILSEVVLDLGRQHITLLSTSDLVLPYWCTSSSVLFTAQSQQCNLTTLILNSILTLPVQWSKTINKIVDTRSTTKLWNFGPGRGLCRGLHQVLEESASSETITWTDDSVVQASVVNSPDKDAIAIVGMAVNLPGARN